MTQFILDQESMLRFRIMLKVMTDQETKEYHLKKFDHWGNKWKQEQKGELAFGG